MRRLLGELLRFGGVGLFATGVHAVVYAIALRVIPPQGANLLGYAAAVLVSYIGHSGISFADRQSALRDPGQIKRFATTSLMGFGLNAAAVAGVTHLLDQPLWALLFIAGVTPLLTFLVLKNWVYTPR